MLIDNKNPRGGAKLSHITTVWDFLSNYGKNPGKFDIVTGYFTLSALSKLHDELPEGTKYRLLSSELINYQNDKKHIIDLLGGNKGIQNSFQLEEIAQKAKAFLLRDSVECRAILKPFCHAKAYIYEPADDAYAGFYVTGSSNLTDSGLGLKSGNSNLELNLGEIANATNQHYDSLQEWYNEIWETAATHRHIDPEDPKSEEIPVKDFFLMQIDNFLRKYSPKEIYYKILFEIFNSELKLDGDSIEYRKDLSLLQESTIWKTLFKYQQKGVISLIKMLRKYNGAILADAVGLGKTFSALAVIKYFQIQGYTTVLLCPKKLERNWTQYKRRHHSRFEADELDYIVRFHTDFQNQRLEHRYDDAKLSWLQRNKKLLIVIDESHNLRNEKSGRYQDLMESLLKDQPGIQNRDVKVLMLSATPINNGLQDVKGQFNMIARGNDSAFNTEDFDIDSLKNLFVDAQRRYSNWCKEEDRTIGGFIKQLPDKFFALTDKLIVARTRDLIEKTLGENLGFPQKQAPINVYQGVDHFGEFKSTEEIYKAFEDLALSAYQPTIFMEDPATGKKTKSSSHKWDDDIYREQFLVKMMGILFMKRLESSWYSLMTTIEKVLVHHQNTLALVDKYLNHKIDSNLQGADGNDDDEENGSLDDDRFTLRKNTIRLSEMKNIDGFKKHLERDIQQLNRIYLALIDFKQKYEAKQEQDVKLDKLESILADKQAQPNKKVVIFTVYADTAKFIYDELCKRDFKNIAAVSGSNVWSKVGNATGDYNTLLQRFAPYSKLYKELDWRDLYEDAKLDRNVYFNLEKHQWDVPYDVWESLIRQHRPKYAEMLDNQIDILVATDCLSEGQNLQDADMQVNYDIHWNPVRLIQRFGRIDRIGSRNETIRCVNFWPAKSFEDYLKLEERVTNRMVQMNLVGSETQAINEEYEQMVKDNPLQDKNADRLLKELKDNSIADIESPRSVSLKDLSLEVFRQDLVDFFEKNKETFNAMPNGIFSGFKCDSEAYAALGECLIAVVGYPRRAEGSDTPYDDILLMCQPLDGGNPAFKPLNRAEVLAFLRNHRDAARNVPEWIDSHDEERIERLSEMVNKWMTAQVPESLTQSLSDIRRSKKGTPIKKKTSKGILLEDKFKPENFDLIVWEYITPNDTI